MSTEDEVQMLCKALIANHDPILLKLAAKKQLALSSALLNNNDDDVTKTDIALVFIFGFDLRAKQLGFTVKELEDAVKGIRLAGEAAHHLSIISEAISDTPSAGCAALLDRVMYPSGPALVKSL